MSSSTGLTAFERLRSEKTRLIQSGYNKGTIRSDIWYLVVSKDVRRHRLISISYISHGRCHGRGQEFESRCPRAGNKGRKTREEDLHPGRIHRLPAVFTPLLPLPWERVSIWLCQWAGRTTFVSDPEILRGKPRVKGTRSPVGLVLGYLAAG